MKKIIACRALFVLMLVTAAFFALLLILSLLSMAQCFAQEDMQTAFTWLFVSLLLLFMCLFYLFFANRAGCRVWYENGCVKRRGAFWGFYKERRVDEITSVTIQKLPRVGPLIVLNDGSKHGANIARRNSCICFEETPKSIAFLASFWKREIG